MNDSPADQRAADAASSLADGGDPGRRHRGLRRVAEAIGEMLGEAVFGAVSLALFAGVATGLAYGWSHDRSLTIGVGVAIALFLAYGVWGALQVRRGARPRWPRVAATGVGTLLIVGMGLATVLAYK